MRGACRFGARRASRRGAVCAERTVPRFATCALQGAQSVNHSRVASGTSTVGISGTVAPPLSITARNRTSPPFATSELAGETSKSEASGVERDKLVVLTTLGCPYCRKTKQALSDAGIPYTVVDLSTRLDALRKVKSSTGRNTVPQVFADGRLLGGSEEVASLLEDGSLKSIVAEAKSSALPPELSDLVSDSAQDSEGDIEGLVAPEGMPLDRYKQLRELATDLSEGLNAEGSEASEQSFTAASAVRWLRDQGQAGDDSAARQLLEDLLTSHLVYVVSEDWGLEGRGAPLRDEDRLRPVANARLAQKKAAPNAIFPWRRAARPASEVAASLRQIALRLYEKHLTPDGRGVKYAALAADPDFTLFATATAELQRVDLEPLTREERIAFFLNAYNVLIVHAQAALGGPSNLLQRLTWFSTIKYRIGGQDYSADAIEHGILRGNRPTAASIPVLLGHPEWSKGFFKKGDPRLEQVVRDMDRRIHFALNCGAKSCPPIKVYTPETLEEGLQSAATAFCEGEVTVDPQEGVVHLSKLFKWYAMDFGPKEELLTWLQDHLPEESAETLRGLMEDPGPEHIRLKYNDYDWGLNDG